MGTVDVKPSHAEAFASLLEPGNGEPEYVAMRRLLLYRKAMANKLVRQKWELNGKGYVAFHEYMRHLKKLQNNSAQNSSQPASPTSTQAALDSGPWAAYERGSWSSSRSMAMSEAQEIPSEPGYSFVGMHCIFDECKASVNIVKFGHMSSELLAFGASNGLITLCSVPEIVHRMTGHSKEVTDLDWSSNNQYLSSSSMDKSVRVWDVKKGECLRVIYGTAPQLSIRFHPVNNNILLVGNGSKEITAFNFSTGRLIHKLALDSDVTALDVDHSGHLLFAGDSRGAVHSVTVKMHHGSFVMRSAHRSSLKHKSATTTIQFRTFSRLAAGPVLLAATQDGLLRFFTVALQIQGYLSLKCSLQLPPRARNIRASFCPLLSLQKGEFIVSGHEDSNVYFYDFTRPRHPCVNKLQGHAVPVVGVAWNHGENLLASSDCEGLVIVWKRAKTAPR